MREGGREECKVSAHVSIRYNIIVHRAEGGMEEASSLSSPSFSFLLPTPLGDLFSHIVKLSLQCKHGMSAPRWARAQF